MTESEKVKNYTEDSVITPPISKGGKGTTTGAYSRWSGGA